MIDDDSMELFKNFGWYQSHFWPGKPVRKKSMYVLEKKSIKIPKYGSVALLWHNAKVLALLKVKCEIHQACLNPVAWIPWVTSTVQKN